MMVYNEMPIQQVKVADRDAVCREDRELGMLLSRRCIQCALDKPFFFLLLFLLFLMSPKGRKNIVEDEQAVEE